ncbi:hypothetical protein [Nostoc sp. CMAA1605]|uniref:hypothetical protein n=1 Tax=Nostoc sp. CMAA1605 TaxID=2055159 RepID=UPI001F4037B9|nr:hypothetical protein [Nostoc sp. CMAA1605]
MPVKLKFFLILMLSVIATAGAGVYLIQHQTAMPIPDTVTTQPPQQLSPVQQTQAVVEDLEREKIPKYAFGKSELYFTRE